MRNDMNTKKPQELDLRDSNEDLDKLIADVLNLCGEDDETSWVEELKVELYNLTHEADANKDKIEKLERENELLRRANAELVNRFGGDTDSIIRSIMVNGGKI